MVVLVNAVPYLHPIDQFGVEYVISLVWDRAFM